MKRTINPSILQNLQNSSLWKKKLYDDCIKQNVFFTIRENRIDLYHKGGLLFKFENGNYRTHIKYAAVIQADDEKINYLSQAQLTNFKLATDFETNYERIKENCSKHSGVEASGVSEIYHRHSFLSNSDVIVLDIEVAFRSEDENKKQDRIDIVLFNKNTRTIQFVEAKHYSNKEIWSTGRPRVLSQLNRYETQIANQKAEIINEYGNLITSINSVFEAALPMPIEIENKVNLLIFGFDDDQKKGRLQKRILKNHSYYGTKIYSIGNISKVNPGTLYNAKILK